MMKKPIESKQLMVAAAVATLWMTSPSNSAEVPQRPDNLPPNFAARPETLEELEEVIVEGRKPESDKLRIRSWLDRLVGDFRYEGDIEPGAGAAAGTTRSVVIGSSRCVRFGKAAAVQCQSNANWSMLRLGPGVAAPRSVTSMTSAVTVYSLELRANYIGVLQVDNDGISTGGKGWLLDDTLVVRSACIDFPGKCERVIRLEAPPDGKDIRMRVDLERESKSEFRYEIRWVRVQATALMDSRIGGSSTPAPAAVGANPIPGEVDAWMRNMVGRYRLTRPRACIRLPKPGDAGACPELKAEVNEAKRDGPVETECQAIGSGPGIRCVVYMDWPESGILATMQQSMKSAPRFVLFGFDPVSRTIARVEVLGAVDTVGPGSFSSGQLVDNELRSRLTYCSGQSCNDSSQIRIAPSGEWIQFIGMSVQPGLGLQPIAWKMYRMQEGSSSHPADSQRKPPALSPRSR